METGGTTKTGAHPAINGDGEVSTDEVSGVFESEIKRADKDIEDWLTEHQDEDGSMSTTDALTLQQMMADQSIIVQTGTSTLKGIKDSILAAVRNI